MLEYKNKTLNCGILDINLTNNAKNLYDIEIPCNKNDFIPIMIIERDILIYTIIILFIYKETNVTMIQLL